MNSEEMKLLKIIAADMQELKSDVSELKSDVSELKSDVSELKSDVSTLKSDVSELKSDVSTLKSDVSELKSAVSELQSDVRSIDRRLTRVELKVENEIEQSIRFLAEGHTGLVEKFGNVPGDIEEIKESVSILKFVQHAMAKNM